MNPFAIKALKSLDFPIDNLRSKSWEEFARPEAPVMDFVFTVCDNAAAETCPVWPGQPMTAHWGVPDPAAVQGSDEEKRQAIRDAASALRRRIELVVNLPLEKLDKLAVHGEMNAAGKS